MPRVLNTKKSQIGRKLKGRRTAQAQQIRDILETFSLSVLYWTQLFLYFYLNTFCPADQNKLFANNVDSDETAHNEPSHQDIQFAILFRFLAETPICNNGFQIQIWNRQFQKPSGERIKLKTEGTCTTASITNENI